MKTNTYVRLLVAALYKPKQSVLLVAGDAKRSSLAWQNLLDEVKKVAPWATIHRARSLVAFPNGSTIRVTSTHADSIRGCRFDHAEVDPKVPQAFFDQIVLPALVAKRPKTP